MNLRHEKIREVTQTTNADDPKWPVIVEDVRFVVLEVLKGSHRFFRGQPVVTRSTVSPGYCGVSARNQPGWIIAIETETPIEFGETWLPYAYDDEPFAMSMCTRSLPLNLREPQQDLELLRQLLDKVPPKQPRWEQAAFADR